MKFASLSFSMVGKSRANALGNAFALCTRYDVRGTIWRIRARCAGRRSRVERDVVIPCAGVVRKERWQTGAAHVRGTMYDVRFGKLARLRRGEAEL